MTWTTWSSVGTSSSWLKSRMRSMVTAVLCYAGLVVGQCCRESSWAWMQVEVNVEAGVEKPDATGRMGELRCCRTV